MKKRWIIVSAACILLAALAFGAGRKPYKNLDASQLASAVVRLSPPDKTVPIADLEELTGRLREVVIYNPDNSYREYCGQGVIFTLTMTDGSQTNVMAYNPFLVIDGVGYQTKYEPCEALSQYANQLLRADEVENGREQ